MQLSAYFVILWEKHDLTTLVNSQLNSSFSMVRTSTQRRTSFLIISSKRIGMLIVFMSYHTMVVKQTYMTIYSSSLLVFYSDETEKLIEHFFLFHSIHLSTVLHFTILTKPENPNHVEFVFKHIPIQPGILGATEKRRNTFGSADCWHAHV